MDGEISPDAVKTLLGTPDAPRIVDIRSPAAFRRGHIPNSENIPFPELPQRIATLDNADRIVTVCPHGQASVQAARLLKSYAGTADARVESMEGGLVAWEGDLVVDTEPDEGPESPF